jgi:hypothetical protein
LLINPLEVVEVLSIMDLMNKELPNLRRDLQFSTITLCRQDPKLLEAIDKLFYGNVVRGAKVNREAQIVLPDRKLNFEEVKNLLKQCSKGKLVINIEKLCTK